MMICCGFILEPHYPGLILLEFMTPRSQSPSTFGTIIEIEFPLATAEWAGLSAESLTSRPAGAVLVIGRPAVPTAQKRLTFFDSDKRNEEQAEVLVGPFRIKSEPAAIRALPRLSVQSGHSRSDTANKKEEHLQKPEKNISLPANLSQTNRA
jgi:hypothetical protein